MTLEEKWKRIDSERGNEASDNSVLIIIKCAENQKGHTTIENAGTVQLLKKYLWLCSTAESALYHSLGHGQKPMSTKMVIYTEW